MDPQPTPYDILPIASFGWVPGLELWGLLGIILAIAVVLLLLPKRVSRRSRGDACTLLLTNLRALAQGRQQLGLQELNAAAQDIKLYLSLTGFSQVLSASSAELRELCALQAQAPDAAFWQLLQTLENLRFQPAARASLAQQEYLQLLDRCAVAGCTVAAVQLATLKPSKGAQQKHEVSS
jgi:hypothetical protein